MRGARGWQGKGAGAQTRPTALPGLAPAQALQVCGAAPQSHGCYRQPQPGQLLLPASPFLQRGKGPWIGLQGPCLVTQAGRLSPPSHGTAAFRTGGLHVRAVALSITPVCRPAAPACGVGCSPAPGTPLGSGHWALSRDMVRSACVAMGIVPARLQAQSLLPASSLGPVRSWDMELLGARGSRAGDQHPWPHAAAKCHRWHARNARARASPRQAVAAVG